MQYVCHRRATLGVCPLLFHLECLSCSFSYNVHGNPSTEIVGQSTGMTLICTESQLPAAHLLFLPRGRNTKHRRPAFPSLVTSFSPKSAAFSVGPSLILRPCKPSSFENSSAGAQDSLGIRPIFCVFLLRMGPFLSIGNVIWFLLLFRSRHTCLYVMGFSSDSLL